MWKSFAVAGAAFLFVAGIAAQSGERWRDVVTEDDPGLRQTSAAKQKRITVLEAKEVLPLSPLTTTFIHAIADATCHVRK